MCAYNSGAVAFPGAQFNPGTGPIFLDQIVCSGSETSVLDCRRHTPLGLPTCEHSQDAGVRCIGMYGTGRGLYLSLFIAIIFSLCPDINECNTTNGGCEQICANAIGSFACNCTRGYQLDENGFNYTGTFTVPKCCLQFTMFYPCMQTLMNVRGMKTIVMRMQTALTQREVSPVFATLAILEMVSSVQVRY